MHTLGIIREFHTPHFTVIVDAVEEYDLDTSFDETGEVSGKLESGELIGFTARARVLVDGLEIASDYLGDCIYESLEAFEDHRACGVENRKLEARGNDGRCGSYFADMIHTVCSEARKELVRLGVIKARRARE